MANCLPITDLRLNLKAREWCRLPYPDHPHGCPNYDHKATCPPKVSLIQDYFDLDEPLYLVFMRFDLAEHVRKMMSLQPRWSERQAKCVLYWQAGVAKALGQDAQEIVTYMNDPRAIYTLCPEAMGVNVIATAQACGLPIRVKPEQDIYKIAFVGYRRNRVCSKL